MRSISSRGPIVFTYALSPKGRCVAYPVGVQLFLLMFYFWVRKGILDFKNQYGLLGFFFGENVLFDGTGWTGWTGGTGLTGGTVTKSVL